MNPCIRYSCHRCCLNTEMPLTEEDINRIESMGFRDFYEEMDGFLVLKNIDGRCYFLGEDGLCKIYEYRPEGCRYYPYVFDISTEKVIPDEECPYYEEFPEPDREEIRKLAERLLRERELRLREPHT